MNKNWEKAFTLVELLGVILIIAFVIVFSVPIVMTLISYSKKSVFKSSAISVIDSVEYYIANNKFASLPEEGIDIKNTSGLNLKNNHFDSGLVVKNKDNKFEIVYLIEGNYCAKGTELNLKVSDQGCGTLDVTAPDIANLSLINSSSNSLTILGIGYDQDSKITKYEFSIDGKKYVTNENAKNSKYTFNNISPQEHIFKVRITNEAGLTTESKEYKFSTLSNEFIDCSLDTPKITSSKTVTCKYSNDANDTYQYAFNNQEYTDIDVNNGAYQFEIKENGTLYTRILSNDKIVGYTSITINNIDDTLNGATPVLTDNMIPVIYDEETKAWIKADSRTIYWDYSNKKWANAVVVREEEDASDENSKSRTYYLSDQAIGKPIFEKDILAYYVWVPRFEYKIWNVNGTDYKTKNNNGEQLIDIHFQTNNSKSDGMTNGLVNNDNYYTHPAFTFNNQELNGIWISKFPASVKEYTECYKNPNIVNCNKSSGIDIYALPGVNPLRNISISSAYILSKNMNLSMNIYGFLTDENTHLIKNTEWGAMAYLAHSIYGFNVITNTSNVTGDNYKEKANLSTTGNVYGIYDTGSLYSEMVMGNYNSDPGTDYDNQSGFVGLNGSVEWPNQMYYDLYVGVTSKSRILGDATGETEGWFNSENDFINGTKPFIVRGGNSININSLFNYTNYSGGPNENLTFRFVVSKQ